MQPTSGPTSANFNANPYFGKGRGQQASQAAPSQADDDQFLSSYAASDRLPPEVPHELRAYITVNDRPPAQVPYSSTQVAIPDYRQADPAALQLTLQQEDALFREALRADQAAREAHILKSTYDTFDPKRPLTAPQAIAAIKIFATHMSEIDFSILTYSCKIRIWSAEGIQEPTLTLTRKIKLFSDQKKLKTQKDKLKKKIIRRVMGLHHLALMGAHKLTQESSLRNWSPTKEMLSFFGRETDFNYRFQKRRRFCQPSEVVSCTIRYGLSTAEHLNHIYDREGKIVSCPIDEEVVEATLRAQPILKNEIVKYSKKMIG